jgi:hypothetical protein
VLNRCDDVEDVALCHLGIEGEGHDFFGGRPGYRQISGAQPLLAAVIGMKVQALELVSRADVPLGQGAPKPCAI